MKKYLIDEDINLFDLKKCKIELIDNVGAVIQCEGTYPVFTTTMSDLNDQIIECELKFVANIKDLTKIYDD